MPDYEDVLRDETHKGGTDTIQQRVYYTLSDRMPKVAGTATLRDVETWVHRTSHVLAAVVAALVEAGTLTEDKLDEILFAATR